MAGIVVLALGVVLMGCASRKMDYVSEESFMNRPIEGKALVFFVRDSPAYAYPEIYDNDEFIGILAAKTHIAYQTAPGKHQFMIISGTVDLLETELDRGKTYISYLKDTPGLWVPDTRFGSFWQIEPSSIEAAPSATRQVTVNREGKAWAEERKSAVRAIKDKHLADMNRPAPAPEPEKAADPTYDSLIAAGKITGLIVLAAGVDYLCAWAAKEYPEATGTLMILAAPLSLSEDLNGPGNLTILAGVAGLGVYNLINHGDDDAARNDRFRTTLYGIPAIATSAVLVDYLTGGSSTQQKKQRVSASLLIGKHEESVVLTWKY